MATTRAVIGTAASQDGAASTTTTKVINTLIGETKLRFKLTAAGDFAGTDIILFPGAARNGSALGLQAKLTFTCSTGFASYADMVNYYQKISTNVYGLIIQTTDTDNYEDNILSVSEQDPSGRTETVKIDLSDYRVSNGTSFSDKIVLQESDFNQIFWPGMEIQLATLKAGTSMTFTLMLRGINKVQELNAIRANVLG